MKAAEAVAIDALRELGLERLTPWALRCVDAYLCNASSDPSRPGYAFDRLLNDLRFSPELLHSEAHWEDARRTAQRSATRPRECSSCGYAPCMCDQQ